MEFDKAQLDVIFEAMGSNYESIFLIDIAEGKINVYRESSNLPKDFWDYVYTNPPYDELLRDYIDSRVLNEDQKRMYNHLCIDALKIKLTNQSVYSYDYRVDASMQPVWYKMRFANLSKGDTLTHFAVVFENISVEKDDQLIMEMAETAKKILIIEDNGFEREILTNILEDDYEIMEACNGEEGLKILENEYDDIAVILLDITMPVCNGYEFLERIKGMHRYSSIPIIVTTGMDSLKEELDALERGASDYIRKPYNYEIVKHRVDSLTRLKTSMAMINTLERDNLTGLYTMEFFCRKAREIICENPDVSYEIIVSDIEKFKMVNDRYGTKVGDAVLHHMAGVSKREIPGYEIGGRISGDKLVYLCTRNTSFEKDIDTVIERILKDCPVHNLSVKYGVYIVDKSEDMSVMHMCDNAKIAVESIKGVYDVSYAVYDDKLRDELRIHQQIISSMDDALKEEQFQIYLQPKHDLHSDNTGGAEALVRWIHPELGFMSPNMFIPLFEKNGFIKELDRYVLECVLKLISKWRDDGKKLFPVSINLSRRDFEDADLADKIIELVDSYNIEHKLIHLELTETAFSDNPDQITNIIDKLHNSGFVIELDDFGTGYSSLTTLTNVAVDILKLDTSIIQNDVPGSDRNVLDFCMQLARMLDLNTVAEGAETKEHTCRLKDVGCDYIQGYYYSKPVPVGEFEEMFMN